METAFPDGACPHVAVLLGERGEESAALARFYALGAKRNGWLYYRSLAGRADADRAALTAAGLDVAGLEAAGGETVLGDASDISVEDYVAGWDADAGGARARFEAVSVLPLPRRPGRRHIDRSVEYDRAWDEPETRYCAVRLHRRRGGARPPCRTARGVPRRC